MLVVLLTCGLVDSVSAQSKKQLENDKAKVEQEIKKLNADLANAKKNSRSSQKQLDLLGRKIDERTKLINNINGQLNQLSINMDETEDAIRRKQVSIDSLRHSIQSLKVEYGYIMRILYRQRGNLDQLSLLLDAKAYNSAYLRTKNFHDYTRYSRRMAHEIRRTEDLLNRERDNLNYRVDSLQRLKNEQSSLIEQQRLQREELSRERKQQQQQLKNNKQQEKKLQQQIAQKEKQKRQLQQQIQRIIDSEVEKTRKQKTAAGGDAAVKKANDADIALSKNFSDNKGKLPWPVAYTKVEREFGRYTHASGGQNMNNGIDLVCQPGTAVKCVFDGMVASVFVGPDGTNSIIVRHGNYMTVYVHLGTVTVNKGAKVKTGQNLGTVYTDASGNAEFSFQLWNEKQVQNPRQWLR